MAAVVVRRKSSNAFLETTDGLTQADARALKARIDKRGMSNWEAVIVPTAREHRGHQYQGLYQPKPII